MQKKGNTKTTVDEKKIYAFLATFLSIIGVIIILFANKRDPYTLHYAKQGIVIFVFWIFAGLLGWIPFFGIAIWILFILTWAMAWINALSGEKRRTLIISEFSEKIKL